MLFHSQFFILAFLPLIWCGWRLMGANPVRREWWLIASSFLFFGWWDWRFLPLLTGSIAINWRLGQLIFADTNHTASRWWLAFGVTFNLALLGLFKYLGFARDIFAGLGFENLPAVSIILPIGISFYTFQQLSFLIDRRRGIAPTYSFRRYALFVSFFPQLIAGPIVRHNELIPQLGADIADEERNRRLGQGLILFIIGLAKKVLIADQLAPHVDAVFAKAQTGTLSMMEAWTGLLSFSYQIYFDFSAYSDMAIGLALLFGLKLPINFNAPYRATSMREFWRRWHITLSQFFRDYLYIPLGGNRFGLSRQLLALTATMALCGLWHGAGWPFVLWGLWHGAGLAVNRLWTGAGIPIPSFIAWAATFLFVLLGWVLFRSPDAATFMSYFAALFSFGGLSTGETGLNPSYLLLALGTIIVLAMPTSQNIAFKVLAPKRWAAIILGLVATALVIHLGEGQSVEFIYFQF